MTREQLERVRDRLAVMAAMLTPIVRKGLAQGDDVTALRAELVEIVKSSDEVKAELEKKPI